MSFYIAGTGSCFPSRKVTNDDLVEILETSDEWIYTRTGIKSRRILTGDETLLDIAVGAAEKALESSGINAADLDLIIFTTIHGDYITPAMSCLLAARIGAKCGQMHDINMACSAFIFALDMADAYFKAGKAEKALIVSAEAMSRTIDWTDRATSVLFGDGSGAAVLIKGNGLKAINLTVQGGMEHLYTPAYKGNCPYNKREAESFLYMDGHEIYVYAVNAMVNEVRLITEKAELETDDIKCFIMHQPNIRILKSAQKRLKIEDDKIPVNLTESANTSSACIPSLLDRVNRSGKLAGGDRIVLCGFGGGLTSASCIIEWQ